MMKFIKFLLLAVGAFMVLVALLWVVILSIGIEN